MPIRKWGPFEKVEIGADHLLNKVAQQAAVEAEAVGQAMDCSHIFLALLEVADKSAVKALVDSGLSAEWVREQIGDHPGPVSGRTKTTISVGPWQWRWVERPGVTAQD